MTSERYTQFVGPLQCAEILHLLTSLFHLIIVFCYFIVFYNFCEMNMLSPITKNKRGQVISKKVKTVILNLYKNKMKQQTGAVSPDKYVMGFFMKFLMKLV